MKNELRIFFTALMFFTRIPVPKSTGYSINNLNKSVRYFPLVGAIVGAVGALVFVFFSWILPVYLAILLSMISTVYLTGAFHEDGFADFSDGFGGGYTKEKILTIMKDSRVGTYGSVGLIFILSTKFGALYSFEKDRIPLLIVAAHTISRFNPVMLMFNSRYVRDDESAKAKPVGSHVSVLSFIVAAVFAIASLLILPVHVIPLVLFITLIVFYIMYRYVNKKIGGYTGDVLGALQQITEVMFYLAILIAESLLKMIV